MKPARTFYPCEVWNCTHVFHLHDVDLRQARILISDHYLVEHPYDCTNELRLQLAEISPVHWWDYVTYYTRTTFFRLVRTEWSENWAAWPHCNGQARCWTHTSSRWCNCACRWCRIARRLRPGYHKEGT